MTTPACHGEAFDAFEAAGWEHAADAYDEFFGPITHRLIDPILDATGVTTGTRLLDIACGPGHLVAKAAARGGRPIAIDIAHAMIRRARATHLTSTSATATPTGCHSPTPPSTW